MIIEIKTSFLAIRQALLTVNTNLAYSIIFGLIQAASSDIFEDRASHQLKNKHLYFSFAITLRFLSEQLGLSSRKETKDWEKMSNDWKILFKKTFFRPVYIVRKRNISITFIMNIDQSGVVLVPRANDAIYEKKRTKQVLIHGKNKQLAFIIILSGSCKSRVLLIQSVWKRATFLGLSTKNLSQETFAAGHRFAFNQNSYWSSFTTTQALIAKILSPC